MSISSPSSSTKVTFFLKKYSIFYDLDPQYMDLMKEIEDKVFKQLGMDEEKFKQWCLKKKDKLIRLRIIRREIETTLKAAFTGILVTDGAKIPPMMNTDMLYQIFLCSREKHFTVLFQIMMDCYNKGMEVSGKNVDYVKAMNSENIQDYKIKEMELRGLEVDTWSDHPAKVLIQATKVAMLNDHVFRIFKTKLYE